MFPVRCHASPRGVPVTRCFYSVLALRGHSATRITVEPGRPHDGSPSLYGPSLGRRLRQKASDKVVRSDWDASESECVAGYGVVALDSDGSGELLSDLVHRHSIADREAGSRRKEHAHIAKVLERRVTDDGD